MIIFFHQTLCQLRDVCHNNLISLQNVTKIANSLTLKTMKKILVIFVSLCSMISAKAQYYHYDVNNDGFINMTDVTLIIDKILNKPNGYLECPDNNHPHMIDLGLPSGTKWACSNVAQPIQKTKARQIKVVTMPGGRLKRKRITVGILTSIVMAVEAHATISEHVSAVQNTMWLQ